MRQQTSAPGARRRKMGWEDLPKSCVKPYEKSRTPRERRLRNKTQYKYKSASSSINLQCLWMSCLSFIACLYKYRGGLHCGAPVHQFSYLFLPREHTARAAFGFLLIPFIIFFSLHFLDEKPSIFFSQLTHVTRYLFLLFWFSSLTYKCLFSNALDHLLSILPFLAVF